MEPNIDMLDHIKIVNGKIQEIIFAENIMNEQEKFLALRATLSRLWQYLLDHFLRSPTM